MKLLREGWQNPFQPVFLTVILLLLLTAVGYSPEAAEPTNAGSLKWRYETGDYVRSSPAIGSDGTIYVGSEDNYLYALNPDGSLKWKYLVGSWVPNSPTIWSDGTIYVTAPYENIKALNPDGTLKWRYEHWMLDGICSPIVSTDRTIYVVTGDYLFAFNPDGSVKWKYEAGIGSVAPTIGPNGTIYAALEYDNLYAFTPSGSMKWSYGTGIRIKTAPAVSSDGTVYFGSGDDFFYALNPNGTLKWRYETGDVIDSSPVIGRDGTVYFGSDDSYLYAMHSSSNGLADTPWPMFQHDLRHTGRVSETSPTTAAKFRVDKQGNVYADKSYHGQEFVSGNADLAEKVKVTEQVEAGDVLSLDPTNPEHYHKSQKPYSNLASGVVSTQPGMTLGSDETSTKATMALMGTVPVKATTENGTIQPGDLLTTSSKPGYAMACKDRSRCAGALIGKALETLEEGEGKIRMLVVS